MSFRLLHPSLNNPLILALASAMMKHNGSGALHPGDNSGFAPAGNRHLKKEIFGTEEKEERHD